MNTNKPGKSIHGPHSFFDSEDALDRVLSGLEET